MSPRTPEGERETEGTTGSGIAGRKFKNIGRQCPRRPRDSPSVTICSLNQALTHRFALPPTFHLCVGCFQPLGPGLLESSRISLTLRPGEYNFFKRVSTDSFPSTSQFPWADASPDQVAYRLKPIATEDCTGHEFAPLQLPQRTDIPRTAFPTPKRFKVIKRTRRLNSTRPK